MINRFNLKGVPMNFGSRSSFALLAFLVYSTTIQSEIITIDSSGDDDHKTFQKALDRAQDGDIILVEPGEYILKAPLNINLQVPIPEEGEERVLGKNLIIRSKEGSESTVLQMSEEPISLEEASIFIFRSGETQQTILDGFTLRKGLGTLTDDPWNHNGGAIVCLDQSSPTIKNCHFNENQTGEGKGGAIYCRDSSPTVENSLFTRNSTFRGGAIALMGESHGTLSGCTFNFNWAEEAAAILCFDGASPKIDRCEIVGNLGYDGYGGGILCEEDSNPIISNCLIKHNQIELGGGGIAVIDSEPQIFDSVITSNDPDGFYCRGEEVTTFKRCEFSGNRIEGAAIRNGEAHFYNCIFYGNEIGVHSDWRGITKLYHCTVSRNEFVGVENSRSFELHMTNCIVWQNPTAYIGTQADHTEIEVQNSCIETDDVWPGEGNINQDPLFKSIGLMDFERTQRIDVRSGFMTLPEYIEQAPNFRLEKGSPARNAGIEVEGVTTDIFGYLRDCEGAPDMGAHENGECLKHVQFLRGDSNNDGQIEISDLVYSLSYLFLGEESLGCIDAIDIDDSGNVSISDPILTVRYLFFGEAPFDNIGHCSLDFSEDDLTCEFSEACS